MQEVSQLKRERAAHPWVTEGQHTLRFGMTMGSWFEILRLVRFVQLMERLSSSPT